ncbi:MAG: DUF1559 domain-containing protein [Cytophagales bacterium]|nr:DUF1559 domain-containing protein [Armatimonadota bacterium]
MTVYKAPRSAAGRRAFTLSLPGRPSPTGFTPSNCSAFTLIELLVVIAIIAILAAILFPVFAQAREKARQASCLSNGKQMGLAIYQYVQDYDETIPVASATYSSGAPAGWINFRWYNVIDPYLKQHGTGTNYTQAGGVFICPSKPDFTMRAGGYGINDNLVFSQFNGRFYPNAGGGGSIVPDSSRRPISLADVPDTAGTFLITDAAELEKAQIAGNANYTPSAWISDAAQKTSSDFQVTPPGSWFFDTNPPLYDVDNDNNRRRPVPRHQGGLTVIYCDGHAKYSNIDRFLGISPTKKSGWGYGAPENSWDNK